MSVTPFLTPLYLLAALPWLNQEKRVSLSFSLFGGVPPHSPVPLTTLSLLAVSGKAWISLLGHTLPRVSACLSLSGTSASIHISSQHFSLTHLTEEEEEGVGRASHVQERRHMPAASHSHAGPLVFPVAALQAGEVGTCSCPHHSHSLSLRVSLLSVLTGGLQLLISVHCVGRLESVGSGGGWYPLHDYHECCCQQLLLLTSVFLVLYFCSGA